MPHPPQTAYVVLEWTSVGQPPSFYDELLHPLLQEAQQVADDARHGAINDGRGEYYTVHELDLRPVDV